VHFVARASRRAASTVVSTFFSAVTALHLEVQREIDALPPILDGVSMGRWPHARGMKNALCLWGRQFWRQPPFRGGSTWIDAELWLAVYFRRTPESSQTISDASGYNPVPRGRGLLPHHNFPNPKSLTDPIPSAARTPSSDPRYRGNNRNCLASLSTTQGYKIPLPTE
jgi:hypothetical protein